MRKNIKIKLNLFITVVVTILIFSACKKFVDAGGPDAQVNAANVYENDATAIAVLTGLYSRIASGVPTPNFSSSIESFSLRCGLSADEYTLSSGADADLNYFYKNELLSTINKGVGTDYWDVFYDHIYFANSAIEGLQAAKSLSVPVKNQLLGEAKFMRAFFYFYLVNLYGDVPLLTTTDYKINASAARSSKTIVYQQIIKDLHEAQESLSIDYLDGALQKYPGTAERIRPTKGAATALLARAYLYNNEWANAEAQSTAVINNITLYDTVPLNDVFLKNSKEAIWQLQPVIADHNTEDARMFIILALQGQLGLSDTLLNSFDSSDNRKIDGNWITNTTPFGNTPYFPYKYKNYESNVTEYLMVLRLAEQYLIRAEARAQQNKTTEAQADLNVIRKRAGLPNTNASDQSSLLTAILHERQVELFSEWGHRWFDLKRTGSVNAVMTVITPQKANGAAWNSYQQLYPIPYNDLWQNSNLSQNPGY